MERMEQIRQLDAECAALSCQRLSDGRTAEIVLLPDGWTDEGRGEVLLEGSSVFFGIEHGDVFFNCGSRELLSYLQELKPPILELWSLWNRRQYILSGKRKARQKENPLADVTASGFSCIVKETPFSDAFFSVYRI